MYPALQPRRRSSQHSEQGYILLTLLLIIALMAIFAAAIVPSITFDIKRDREEELIHRGVQYSRAIRAYYKKFGRYPVKLEDLESANNMRFLRKRYKDPISGQDFRLLHFGEVKLTFAGALAPVSAPNPGIGPMNGTPGFSPGPGTSTSSNLNQNSATNQDQQSNGNGADPSSQSQTGAGGNNNASTGQSTGDQSADQSSGDQPSGPTFGGGPVVGVVSVSKKDTIREFNHKRKYNEWQFIYDPGTDRGGLLMTPNQPPILGFGQNPQNLNGQPNNGVGNGLPPAGMQNNPNLPPSGGNNPPAQPEDQPVQQ